MPRHDVTLVTPEPSTPATQLRSVAFGGARRIAGTVYGTVIVMSTIVAGSADHTGWDLTTLVASTALVIWIAHVYAHELGESIEMGQRLDWKTLRGIASRQLPILAAAAAPTLMLALGAAGILQEGRAIWAAIGLGLVTLGVQGARYARLERLGVLGTGAIVAINLALGGAVVALKVLAE
jgi:hypothetical protein